MRASMVKRVATVVAALGLAGAGVGIFPTAASAAPATADNLDLCVDSNADYSAFLRAPNGSETVLASPGECTPWTNAPGGRRYDIGAYYHGLTTFINYMTTNGSIQIVYAHGSMASGTAHATVTNY